MHSRLAAIGARVFAMAGTFVQVVVVSRSLNIDHAGQVFILFTLMNLAATAGRFGTDNLVLKRIASLSPGDNVEARWLRMLCIIASCLAGTGLFVLLTTGLLQLSSSPVGPMAAACLGLMTVFYALNVFLGAVLRASGKMVAGIMAELGIAPWLTVLFLVASSMIVDDIEVFTVLLYMLVSGLATFLWAFRATTSNFRVAAVFDWSGFLTYSRSHLSSLASLMGTSLLFFALVWVPQLCLGLVGTGAQVAEYTAAARVASFISIFPGIQSSYLAPRLAQLAHTGHIGQLSRECGKAALQAALIAVPLLTLIAAESEFVLRLFGSAYQGAVTPTLILCIGAYAVLAFGQVNTVMLTAGLEKSAVVLNAVLLLTVASVAISGASTLGVAGVAAASALGSLGYAALASLLIRIRLKVNTTIGTLFADLLVGDRRESRYT